MIIRSENSKDKPAIQMVNESAFETPAEANLVDLLRDQVQPIISVVAEDNGVVVGHIMFSPVELNECPELKIMGLAPMAVLPDRQRQGIGTALVNAGLEACKKLGVGAVAVLGHPQYYPRFGFEPAVMFGIRCEYDVPEDVFMVLELQPGYLKGARGIIKYHPAFNDV